MRSSVDLADIRWIAFDAVGTLIHVDPPVAQVYAMVAHRYGSRLTEEEIRRRFLRTFSQIESEESRDADWDDPRCLRTDEERERQRWRSIVSTVLDDVTDRAAAFEELFAHFGAGDAWSCYPDVEEALTWCSGAGYRLAIASNFDSRLHAVCDHLPELRFLQRRIVSSEVGYRKPSRFFYAALIDATGCQPREILMIGDDLSNDWEGARHAGLQALLLGRNSDSRPGALTGLWDLPRWLGR